jgi:hypothetical protein
VPMTEATTVLAGNGGRYAGRTIHLRRLSTEAW